MFSSSKNPFYIDENILKKVFNFLRDKLITIFNSLKFGETKSMPIRILGLQEENAYKGAGGLIAEYVCGYNLATQLEESKLDVVSDINSLKSQMENKIKQFEADGMPKEMIQRAVNQGQAIADSMYQSIVNDGKDLIFTEYQFNTSDHNYDIVLSGADTSKDTADDLELIVTKKSEEDVKKNILVSLKAYASHKTSLGSNSSTGALAKLFMGKSKINAKDKDDFINHFGPLAKEMLDSMETFKNDAVEYMNSPDSKELRDYWDGKGKKANSKGLYPNNLRRKEVGDYYEKKRGHKSEHKLSKLFVDLFKVGRAKVNSSAQEKMFKEGMMQILGIDDSVVTYNAIADDKGVVSEVVNSNVSSGYKKLYEAIKGECNITLESRSGAKDSTVIDVILHHENTKIKGLALAMWKDGTIQFSYDPNK